MKVTLLHFGLLASLASPALAMSTQDADESALDALDAATPKPAVVTQEPAGAAELRDAVRRIAQRPTDSFALADAGYAAIKLGDYDAAFNFFTRANGIQPADSRIKAGLGIAQVRRENPFEALSLFDEAARLGASERSFALDRALAFDLLGNFERAERDYALAASYGQTDELTLRHAMSLSLSGKKDEADRMLIPLLQREDPAAWRARAMMLAARGDYKEAGKIAQGFLSVSEAKRMEGYFRNMPRLTGAQQAAAMHFGHFPVGSSIGEDSDAVRTMAAATGAKPAPAGGDNRLIPAGEPLGAKAGSAKPAKPKKPGKGGRDGNPAGVIATASAQQAIDVASTAKVTTVAATQLPPPETARPPVRIALPALARPQPVVEPSKAVPAPAVEPIKTAALDIKPEPTPPSISQPTPKPAVASPATLPPAEPVKIAVADIKTEPAPTRDEPAPSPGFVSIDPTAVIDQNAPAPVAATPTPQPASETIATADLPPAAAPSPVMGPGLDGNPIVKTAMADPAPAPAPAPAETIPPQTAPVAEKSFDLGALVESIEVPEDEKKPSVAPVDLKKIKPAGPKVEEAAAKADPAAKGAKPPVAGPRIWVQVATGGDLQGLGYDYRRMEKKFGALFANVDGWTSPWGKARRLLVGPFTDMKAAKKWEVDFRKAGGDGFVWQSDKNAEVEKLKGK